MRLSITTYLIIVLNILGKSQSNYIKRIEYRDPKTRMYITKYVNDMTGDTTRYEQSGEYTVINKQNIKIVEGHRGGGITHPCGCEPRKHGAWIYRYSNGQIDSIGNYNCDLKIGEWKYFYPNGSIKKVENFIVEKTHYERLSLQTGDYKEFNNNGNLTVQGQFKIIEKQDSIKVLDPNTYDFMKIWGNTLKSVKKGIWLYYDSKKIILRKEEYD